MSITVADIPHWRRIFDPTGQPAGYVWTTDGAGGGSYQPAGGGGGSTIIIQDEGITLTTAADTLDFVGAGVTASGTGTTKTITIPGGGVFQQTANNIFGGNLALSSLTSGTSNFAAMDNALLNVTSESSNVAVGENSGLRVTSLANTCIGHQALTGAGSINLTGGNNTGCGFRAGAQINGTSQFNTFAGADAGFKLTIGEGNTIVGGRAISSGVPITGDFNTAVGYEAGFVLALNSDENTLIGASAGRSLAFNAIGNVCLGYQAGPTTTLSNQLFIDNSQRNDPLIGGDFVARTVSLQNMVFDADQSIGPTEDDYVLTYDDALGTIQLEPAAGGGLFTEDSNGNIIGGSLSAQNFGIFAQRNFIGGSQCYETFATSVDDNVAVGNRAGRYCTGNRNIQIGYESGRGFSTAALSGNDNVCVGYRAGVAMTGSASRNVAIGFEAGQRYNTNGNISIGYESGTQIGGAGSFNTCVGDEAGRAIGGGGENNTLIGKGAGRNITNLGGDSDNICLGHEAGPTTTAGASDQLWIDVTQRDDPLIKGNFLTRLLEINGQFDADGNTATVSFRVDNNVTATETRMLLWDVDNATLARVSVGAANSGGAGFKVLRIPN